MQHNLNSPRRISFLALTALTTLTALSAPAAASVTTFTGSATPADWLSAVGGPVTTITFDGMADGTVVTNQFADQGIVFTQTGVVGNTTTPTAASYLVCQTNRPANQPIQATDGFRATFSAPMHALGMSAFCPSSTLMITLYSGGNAIWSGMLGPNFNPTENAFPLPFCGLLSDQGFDAVWVAPTPSDGYPGIVGNFLVTDTLSFSTVPGPGVLGLQMVGMAWSARWRGRRKA